MLTAVDEKLQKSYKRWWYSHSTCSVDLLLLTLWINCCF